ncbi:MAG: galactokinase, partial [Chloroflexota bacterium]
YHEGFVLPCAIERRVAVALGAGTGGLVSLDYREVCSLDGCAKKSWAAYPRGVAWALAEAGYPAQPFQAVFHGDVPRSAGLSSSAAIEAATAMAINARFELGISRKDLAILCRRAENGYMGVHSGIMDQYAALLCEPGSALFIDCRSLDAQQLPLPLEASGLALLVCDTGVKRDLRDSGYNERRAACDRAAAALGVPALRDATAQSIESLSGEERRCAQHVVGENKRVRLAAGALSRTDFTEFGRLMYESHNSLRDTFRVSTAELDTFVEVAARSVALGARLTGAGFGGCALALIEEHLIPQMEAAVSGQFQDRGFSDPTFFRFVPSAGASVARVTGSYFV